jgi:hypothetical protein
MGVVFSKLSRIQLELREPAYELAIKADRVLPPTHVPPYSRGLGGSSFQWPIIGRPTLGFL